MNGLENTTKESGLCFTRLGSVTNSSRTIISILNPLAELVREEARIRKIVCAEV